MPPPKKRNKQKSSKRPKTDPKRAASPKQMAADSTTSINVTVRPIPTTSNSSSTTPQPPARGMCSHTPSTSYAAKPANTTPTPAYEIQSAVYFNKAKRPVVSGKGETINVQERNRQDVRNARTRQSSLNPNPTGSNAMETNIDSPGNDPRELLKCRRGGTDYKTFQAPMSLPVQSSSPLPSTPPPAAAPSTPAAAAPSLPCVRIRDLPGISASVSLDRVSRRYTAGEHVTGFVDLQVTRHLPCRRISIHYRGLCLVRTHLYQKYDPDDVLDDNFLESFSLHTNVMQLWPCDFERKEHINVGHYKFRFSFHIPGDCSPTLREDDERMSIEYYLVLEIAQSERSPKLLETLSTFVVMPQQNKNISSQKPVVIETKLISPDSSSFIKFGVEINKPVIECVHGYFKVVINAFELRNKKGTNMKIFPVLVQRISFPSRNLILQQAVVDFYREARYELLSNGRGCTMTFEFHVPKVLPSSADLDAQTAGLKILYLLMVHVWREDANTPTLLLKRQIDVVGPSGTGDLFVLCDGFQENNTPSKEASFTANNELLSQDTIVTQEADSTSSDMGANLEPLYGEPITTPPLLENETRDDINAINQNEETEGSSICFDTKSLSKISSRAVVRNRDSSLSNEDADCSGNRHIRKLDTRRLERCSRPHEFTSLTAPIWIDTDDKRKDGPCSEICSFFFKEGESKAMITMELPEKHETTREDLTFVFSHDNESDVSLPGHRDRMSSRKDKGDRPLERSIHDIADALARNARKRNSALSQTSLCEESNQDRNMVGCSAKTGLCLIHAETDAKKLRPVQEDRLIHRHVYNHNLTCLDIEGKRKKEENVHVCALQKVSRKYGGEKLPIFSERTEDDAVNISSNSSECGGDSEHKHDSQEVLNTNHDDEQEEARCSIVTGNENAKTCTGCSKSAANCQLGERLSLIGNEKHKDTPEETVTEWKQDVSSQDQQVTTIHDTPKSRNGSLGCLKKENVFQSSEGDQYPVQETLCRDRDGRTEGEARPDCDQIGPFNKEFEYEERENKRSDLPETKCRKPVQINDANDTREISMVEEIRLHSGDCEGEMMQTKDISTARIKLEDPKRGETMLSQYQCTRTKLAQEGESENSKAKLATIMNRKECDLIDTEGSGNAAKPSPYDLDNGIITKRDYIGTVKNCVTLDSNTVSRDNQVLQGNKIDRIQSPGNEIIATQEHSNSEIKRPGIATDQAGTEYSKVHETDKGPRSVGAAQDELKPQRDLSTRNENETGAVTLELPRVQDEELNLFKRETYCHSGDEHTLHIEDKSIERVEETNRNKRSVDGEVYASCCQSKSDNKKEKEDVNDSIGDSCDQTKTICCPHDNESRETPIPDVEQTVLIEVTGPQGSHNQFIHVETPQSSDIVETTRDESVSQVDQTDMNGSGTVVISSEASGMTQEGSKLLTVGQPGRGSKTPCLDADLTTEKVTKKPRRPRISDRFCKPDVLGRRRRRSSGSDKDPPKSSKPPEKQTPTAAVKTASCVSGSSCGSQNGGQKTSQTSDGKIASVGMAFENESQPTQQLGSPSSIIDSEKEMCSHREQKIYGNVENSAFGQRSKMVEELDSRKNYEKSPSKMLRLLSTKLDLDSEHDQHSERNFGTIKHVELSDIQNKFPCSTDSICENDAEVKSVLNLENRKNAENGNDIVGEKESVDTVEENKGASERVQSIVRMKQEESSGGSNFSFKDISHDTNLHSVNGSWREQNPDEYVTGNRPGTDSHSRCVFPKFQFPPRLVSYDLNPPVTLYSHSKPFAGKSDETVENQTLESENGKKFCSPKADEASKTFKHLSIDPGRNCQRKAFQENGETINPSINLRMETNPNAAKNSSHEPKSCDLKDIPMEQLKPANYSRMNEEERLRMKKLFEGSTYSDEYSESKTTENRPRSTATRKSTLVDDGTQPDKEKANECWHMTQLFQKWTFDGERDLGAFPPLDFSSYEKPDACKFVLTREDLQTCILHSIDCGIDMELFDSNEIFSKFKTHHLAATCNDHTRFPMLHSSRDFFPQPTINDVINRESSNKYAPFHNENVSNKERYEMKLQFEGVTNDGKSCPEPHRSHVMENNLQTSKQNERHLYQLDQQSKGANDSVKRNLFSEMPLVKDDKGNERFRINTRIKQNNSNFAHMRQTSGSHANGIPAKNTENACPKTNSFIQDQENINYCRHRSQFNQVIQDRPDGYYYVANTYTDSQSRPFQNPSGTHRGTSDTSLQSFDRVKSGRDQHGTSLAVNNFTTNRNLNPKNKKYSKQRLKQNDCHHRENVRPHHEQEQFGDSEEYESLLEKRRFYSKMIQELQHQLKNNYWQQSKFERLKMLTEEVGLIEKKVEKIRTGRLHANPRAGILVPRGQSSTSRSGNVLVPINDNCVTRDERDPKYFTDHRKPVAIRRQDADDSRQIMIDEIMRGFRRSRSSSSSEHRAPNDSRRKIGTGERRQKRLPIKQPVQRGGQR